ncbi:LIC12162 family transferase [Sulfurirhabdus autotrophica]|uniref:Putative transferase (TIGR04331 family) n=1 Tax=Sulfurirhabdus autotrophica TaxID=1706046 RepID=A0A4R3XWY1_9PROT|nr:LIC12162 family protein [Sulfurirhabdus autotrophica]TCV84265.1 putative transferase (TIGR04331 family) [Sulfurirhabdus autotrophica]
MNNIHANGNEEVFLVTTALAEFWDTTKPIIFLGEWCLRYKQHAFWEKVDGKLMESPFREHEQTKEAYDYINRLYEKILPLLGDALNSIHEVNYSNHYWRIVVGPWLHYYLSTVYDRYIHLKSAMEKHPKCTTIGLSEESFVTPHDTLDFICYLLEDSFNLQIYTKLLSALGRAFPRKKVQINSNTLYTKMQSSSLKSRIFSRALKVCLDLFANIWHPTLLVSPYFSRHAEFQLLFKSYGKVLPFRAIKKNWSSVSCDKAIREKLKVIPLGKDEFECCLSSMLFSDVPHCYLEGFKGNKESADTIYPKKVKAIFSANSWYYDEPFKHWAATSADKGALLLGAQHGGSYGGLAMMVSENHETAITDYYFSWGWERADCMSRVIPFSATKLAGREKIGANNQQFGILWAGTALPRYLVQFPLLPKYFNEYLSWQRRFANVLSQNARAEVRVRLLDEDYGWDIAQRLIDTFPDIKIETSTVSFLESLGNCRLYVCDHFSTTFAEALAANKPTILFWNSQTNELRPEAQSYFDLLRKGGILFDTPESAGEALNQIYDDVETWWNDSERQNIVEMFCERFARNSPDAIELWVAEFKRLEAMPGLKVNRVG